MITKIAGADVDIITNVRVVSRRPLDKLDILQRATIRGVERLLEEQAEDFVERAVNKMGETP
jgi:hypothetical protein